MPKERIVEVDDVADFKDLFDLLCDEVLNLDPMDVRRGLLNFRGTDAAVRDNKIRANDLFKIIEMKGIKFSLKLDYTSNVIIKSTPALEPPVKRDPKIYKNMMKQAQEIPPELLPTPVNVEKIIEETKPYRPPAMDIPDFL